MSSTFSDASLEIDIMKVVDVGPLKGEDGVKFFEKKIPT
jgi:hypothetical protein